jgi:FKBP-type peptidyl-prolyl cis-trans isomerase
MNEHTTLKKSFAVLASTVTLAGIACAAGADRKLPEGLYAEIDTIKGKILLRLEFEKTPLTVANFVGLAEGTRDSNKPKGTKFYDGLNFHRVIPDFMIQGGCPQGSGSGGPGYRFADEIDPSLKHDGPGVLSMANAGPGSNGSQFFITHKDTPWLDGKHSVFGRVVEGQDVVNKIAGGDKMNSVKIIRVGDKAKAFKGDQAHFDSLLKQVDARGAAERDARAVKERAQIDAVLADLTAKHPGKLVTSASGLKYVVTQEGSGEKPARGKAVKAHYTGRLLDGRVFDSSVQRGEPIEFPVGAGAVIKGWDEALSDMKKGEKRVLIIPPNLAYGERGAGGVIPPNATLVFEVEMVGF